MPQEDLKNRVLQSPNNLIWSVKDQREVSGPLGGVSVEYILEVNTSRYEFKTSFQGESAVVNFTISKTFREVEYLYNKLKNQYSAITFPDFFKKDKKQPIESVEERCIVINKVLAFVSEHSSLVTSPILLDFIDFHPNKQAANIKLASNRQPNVKSSSNVEDGKAKQKSTHNAQPENIFGVDVGCDNDDDDDDDLFKKIKPNNTSERVTSSKASSSLRYSDEHLLYERQDLGGALLKDEDEIFTPLSAKLGLDRLDNSEQALEDATELLRVDDSLSDILEEIQKKPSKPPVKTKPIIKPKPVLNVSKDKPVLSPRPHTLVSTRPVPPPRATLSSKGAASPTLSPSSSDSPSSKSIGSDVTPATDEIDILDYINKEVNAMKDNLDLF